MSESIQTVESLSESFDRVGNASLASSSCSLRLGAHMLGVGNLPFLVIGSKLGNSSLNHLIFLGGSGLLGSSH